MKRLFGKDELIQEADRIDLKLEDKVVAVVLKNQGTAILKSGLNRSAIAQTLPNATNPYGGIEGFYMEGFLTIDFDESGSKSCIITIYYDRGEIDEC